MKNLSLQELKSKIRVVTKELNRFKLLIFLLFVIAIYGYVYNQINSLYNQQPSQTAVTAINDPIRSALIDKKAVNQLQTLNNNSVNVQALFNQARTNPFQDSSQ